MVSPRVETTTKRRLALVVLALLLLWPPIHYALSRAYHLDHWRFSGFAMYTRPTDQPLLEFADTLAHRPLDPARLRSALGHDVTRIDAFVARRKLWGELARPDALARLILSRLPELAELTITIDTVGLRPATTSSPTAPAVIAAPAPNRPGRPPARASSRYRGIDAGGGFGTDGGTGTGSCGRTSMSPSSAAGGGRSLSHAST